MCPQISHQKFQDRPIQTNYRKDIEMKDEIILEHLRNKYPGENRAKFNFLDFIHAAGSPSDALLYARLFSPQFIEIDEMIFLKDVIEDEADIQRVRNAIEKYAGDKKIVEHSFNFVEIPSLFGGNSGDTSDEEDYWLATQLAEMWALKLKILYPEKTFEVNILLPTETGNELGIEFFQK